MNTTQQDSHGGDDEIKAKTMFIMNQLIKCGKPEAKEIRGKYYPIVPYIEMAKWVEAYTEQLATRRAVAELEMVNEFVLNHELNVASKHKWFKYYSDRKSELTATLKGDAK